jgi:hypothetical protein
VASARPHLRSSQASDLARQHAENPWASAATADDRARAALIVATPSFTSATLLVDGEHLVRRPDIARQEKED